MIAYDEALALILEHASPLGTMELPLSQLQGRVLAEPIRAPFDLPRFDNSAVDGFGVRVSDVVTATAEQPVRLRSGGTLPAGADSTCALQAGEAIKILTGAPVPPGVEAVIMQEFTETQNGHVGIQRTARPGENIRRRGEEFQAGEDVLPARTRISPPVVGLLASLGYATARVYQPPRVAVVVTGNELVAPGQPLAPGQIYDSNSHSLVAALTALNCAPVSVTCVADAKEAIHDALARALDQADVVITTGGVSVGEFDWVKDVMADLDVEPRFWRVAIKPGKPVFYGNQGSKQIFGLPGNPVAVLLTFYLLVRPALQQMQGLKADWPALPQARLLQDLRKKPERLDFVRGQLHRAETGWAVRPTVGQGSHMLGGLTQADCLIAFDRQATHWPAGTHVDVIPLDWRAL